MAPSPLTDLLFPGIVPAELSHSHQCPNSNQQAYQHHPLIVRIQRNNHLINGQHAHEHSHGPAVPFFLFIPPAFFLSSASVDGFENKLSLNQEQNDTDSSQNGRQHPVKN